MHIYLYKYNLKILYVIIKCDFTLSIHVCSQEITSNVLVDY